VQVSDQFRYICARLTGVMVTCPCGKKKPVAPRGRTPIFCSDKCRIAAHRRRRKAEIPAELRRVTRWTRRDGKRPITVDGRSASSTDPRTWTTFAAVQRGSGDGFGIMLGDGLACYDLDHCLTDGELSDQAAEILARLSPIYTEVSMSGDGLHIFLAAPEAPGYKRPGVEFYSRARFIAVTGRRWDA
jgi:primase-polymerase (primpol)-like protein